MRLLPLCLLALFSSPCFGQAPLFIAELPAGFEAKTDLWIVKLEPTKDEPDGALYMVQQRFLDRYAHAGKAGYPWSWAPLSRVLIKLNAPDASHDAGVDGTLPLENQRLKAKVRAAVELLSQ